VIVYPVMTHIYITWVLATICARCQICLAEYRGCMCSLFTPNRDQLLILSELVDV